MSICLFMENYKGGGEKNRKETMKRGVLHPAGLQGFLVILHKKTRICIVSTAHPFSGGGLRYRPYFDWNSC